ncbi:MAG: hypothetical protein QM783_00850 [Phycisphaerales bacterium]
MRTAVLMFSLTAVSGGALAQPQYTFEMRLIPDGVPGAPIGPGTVYNIGSSTWAMGTRVGFWLQARVMQTAGENWGIVRASSPADGVSFITLSTAGTVFISRGSVNGGNTLFGRGSGYHNGGVQTGNTGNSVGSAPFPGTAGNENGGLDSTRPDFTINRIFGFDAWVGATRSAANLDEPSQPWNVNGRTGAGSPTPLGMFSPWASLYRIWIDIPDQPYSTATLSASAWLNGSLQAVPTTPDLTVWEMQPGPGQLATANFQFGYGFQPTPSATALLALSAAFSSRRRRRASVVNALAADGERGP